MWSHPVQGVLADESSMPRRTRLDTTNGALMEGIVRQQEILSARGHGFRGASAGSPATFFPPRWWLPLRHTRMPRLDAESRRRRRDSCRVLSTGLAVESQIHPWGDFAGPNARPSLRIGFAANGASPMKVLSAECDVPRGGSRRPSLDRQRRQGECGEAANALFGDLGTGRQSTGHQLLRRGS